MAEIHRKADPTLFSPGELFTPFSEAGQTYDRPIGAWREKAYEYRLITFLLLGLILVLAISFLFLCFTPRVRVFAVSLTSSGFSTGVYELKQEVSNNKKEVRS